MEVGIEKNKLKRTCGFQKQEVEQHCHMTAIKAPQSPCCLATYLAMIGDSGKSLDTIKEKVLERQCSSVPENYF